MSDLPRALPPTESVQCSRCHKPMDANHDCGDGDTWEHLCSVCMNKLNRALNVDAQEETVAALYGFADALGVNSRDPEQAERIRKALPLARIVTAFGFNVASIQ